MDSRILELVENLKETMEGAADWEKVKTNIPGIFLVKMPYKELRVRIEFNPPDDSGAPTKRKGIYFDDMETVDAAKKAFFDSRLEDLVQAIQNFKGKPKHNSNQSNRLFSL